MIGVGVGLPAHHNKVTGPIAKQNVVLNMRVHHRTRYTETHVPVGGRIERILSLAKSNFAPKTSDNTHEHDSDDLPTARMPFPGDLETALGQTGVTRTSYHVGRLIAMFNLISELREPRPARAKKGPISFIITTLPE